MRACAETIDDRYVDVMCTGKTFRGRYLHLFSCSFTSPGLHAYVSSPLRPMIIRSSSPHHPFQRTSVLRSSLPYHIIVTEPLNGTENAGPSSYIPQIANKHMDRASPPRTICHVEHPRVDNERSTMWSDSEWQTPLSSSISRVELSGGRDTSADKPCWWWAPGVDAGPPPHARPLYSTIPLPAEDLPCAFDTSELRSTLGTSTKSTMLPLTSASKMSLAPNPIHQPIPRYFSAQAPFSVLQTEPSPCPSPSRRSAPPSDRDDLELTPPTVITENGGMSAMVQTGGSLEMEIPREGQHTAALLQHN
ncbi:hypothetical protein FPV67DRAFT_1117511 [Lyophyllum atratum]|nr:hypothetical protein FPV67DRAFT_1117511 [Lyophyllum atratum]